MDCSVTSIFCSEALTWFNHVNSTSIELSNKQIALIPSFTAAVQIPKMQTALICHSFETIHLCLENNVNVSEFQTFRINTVANRGIVLFHNSGSLYHLHLQYYY